MRRLMKISLFSALLASTMLAVAQTYVRQGDNKYSTPIYNWDGTYLRKGDNKYGTPICNWDGVYRKIQNNNGDDITCSIVKKKID